MFISHLLNWFLRISLYFILLFVSCKGNQYKAKHQIEGKLNVESYFDLPDYALDKEVYYIDTITAQTTEELSQQLRSNRVIKLVNRDYRLPTTLLIDSIRNLKIVGADLSKLMIDQQNATVIQLLNAQNTHLENLIIGHTESSEHKGETGILRISHANNITISNCKILGAGTFGLVTYDVTHLNFTNSEITACTLLIFELEKSRLVEFKNSKFYNNHLATSVLGGFTTSTKEVTFSNSDFLNNTPAMSGNPAFNFYENYENRKEPIVFSDCTFKNNKGFKWYKDKVKLNNCQVDSLDFIGF